MWRANFDKHGNRVGSEQSRCIHCNAAQSWVHDHKRGDASKGILTREFVVEGEERGPRVRTA